MITKEVTIELTQEEIDSSEDIELKFNVKGPGPEIDVTYTINYPKD